MQRLLHDIPVRLDGRRIAKPSAPVAAGQVLTLPFGGRVRVLQILALPERRGPAAEARTYFRELNENANDSHQ